MISSISKWELQRIQHMIAGQHYVASFQDVIFIVCEELIKRLILTTIGFERVNEAVKLQLRQQLMNLCLSELAV